MKKQKKPREREKMLEEGRARSKEIMKDKNNGRGWKKHRT